MSLKRFTPIFFLLYSFAALYSTVREGMLLSGAEDYQIFVKPLLMPLLAVYFISRVGFSFGDNRRLLLLALFFCWLGDIFLMYTDQSDIFFILGLSSFLLGHVFYIICYRKFVNGPLASRPDTFLMLLLIAYFLWVFFKILPGLGPMLVPVIVYSIIIMSMVFMANMRRTRTNTASYWLVLLGALLFVISDSVIALSRFHQEIPLIGSMVIMSTYTIGQFLIVQGLVIHWEEEKSEVSTSHTKQAI